MKISNSQLFDTSIGQMTRKQSEISQMQAKLASGKQLVKPSDDAHKAALIQRLNSAMQRQDVFESSLNRADNRLATEETAVMGAENILQRIRELAIQGTNGGLNDSDRETIAKEVNSLRDSLFSLSNTQDTSGNYIFSGTAVKSPAYAIGADDAITYQGNQNQTSVDISETRRVAINRPGDQVFSSVVRTIADAEAETIGFFEVLSDFSSALTTGNTEGLSQSLTEISTLTDDVAMSLADLGSRMNTIDSQRDVLADTKMRYQELLSNAEDLDLSLIHI